MEKRNFTNESLNNSMKTTEKIHYLGDLRIIGQVVETLSSSNILGYVIMTEKTQNFKMYTVNQTKSLLTRFKFVNAKLEGNEIVNTECAMNRMPKFDKNMRVIGNHGIIVLGEIVDGNNKIGYRAMDTNAQIVDIDEQELVALYNHGVRLLNAKVVRRENKSTISAIKSEFTKIEKKTLREFKPKTSPGLAWRKQMHAKKLKEIYYPNVVVALFTKRNQIFTDTIYARDNSRGSRYAASYVDLDRELIIAVKEIFSADPNSDKIHVSENDSKIFVKLKSLNHNSKLGNVNGQYIRHNTNDEIFMSAIAQFILNDGDRALKIFNRILKKSEFNVSLDRAKAFIESGYASDNFKNFYKNVEHSIENRKHIPEVTDRDRQKMFKTTTFTKAEEVAQLGFAITESNDGFLYKTLTGGKKTLSWLGRYIDDYSNLKSKARCLGDLYAVAVLDYIKMEGHDRIRISEEDCIASIEAIIAISLIYDSPVMKEYLKNENVQRWLHQECNIDTSIFNELNSTEYKLPEELKLYYASGFNVFLNDNEYRQYKYKHAHLTHAEYINYRNLGPRHQIKHPLITDDLASIINMVTSDNCNAENIDRIIGKLRFF